LSGRKILKKDLSMGEKSKKKKLKKKVGRKRTVRPSFDKEGLISPVHRVEGATPFTS
jgi:hypothetical protein